MTILITLTTAGQDTGPFDLYSNGSITPFETGILKSALTAGLLLSTVPDGTTIIRVSSTGLCDNFIDLEIVTTTTTTSSSSSTTTTTTSQAPNITFKWIGDEPTSFCEELTVSLTGNVVVDPSNSSEVLATLTLSAPLTQLIEVVLSYTEGNFQQQITAFVIAGATTGNIVQNMFAQGAQVTFTGIVSVSPNPVGGVNILY